MTPSQVNDADSRPKASYDINIPYQESSEDYEKYIRGRTEFPQYLPTWEEGLWFEDFPAFEFHDPALRADKKKPNLFKGGVTSYPVTPRMGTVLIGCKLENLSKEGKDELALLICERKFVVVRDQLDFLKTGPQFQVDFMEYYGKLSHQPVSGSVKGFPQFHIIHRDGNEDEIEQFLKYKTTTTLWHHDVSYERQPPGYIMLGILACPDVGGDTVVADMSMAYKRLSPVYQQMLNQLMAVHTSEKMIDHTKRAKKAVRADPVDSTHPVIRVHPVTGERAIFLNAEFPKEIIGLKNLEAESVTKFVMDHIRMGHDFQARVSWEKHSVVMFDGRTTLHTGTVDYDTSLQARHLFRLAAMTEIPVSVAEGERRLEGHV